jgi:hypothetical protein
MFSSIIITTIKKYTIKSSIHLRKGTETREHGTALLLLSVLLPVLLAR